MKKFQVLLIFIVLSLMGTAATDFSLGLWVLNNNESTVTYSIISFIIITPQVLLSPFMGSLIDRWNKKKIIIWGQLIAGLASMSLMLLYLIGDLKPGHIMAVSFFSSIANAFVFQAFYIVTVTLVPKSKLSRAKGLERAAFSLVAIGVPMAAPFLYQSIDLNGIFLIDVITFTASILAFIFIKFGDFKQEPEKLTFIKDAKIVWQFLKSTKGYMPLLWYFFIINFTLAILALMLAPMVIGFSDESTLGLVMTMAGFGTLAGGLIMSAWKGFDKAVRGIIFLNLIIALLLFAIPFKLTVVSLCVMVLLVMFCNTMINSTTAAFWHTIIPIDLQGRVLGYQNFLIGAATPLAYLSAGFLVDYVLTPFLFSLPVDLWSEYYIGSDRTTTILLLFLLAGVINFFVSLALVKRKFVKNVDNLYMEKKNENTQQTEEKQTEKEELLETT